MEHTKISSKNLRPKRSAIIAQKHFLTRQHLKLTSQMYIIRELIVKHVKSTGGKDSSTLSEIYLTKLTLIEVSLRKEILSEEDFK